ncbi:hypothetical protein CVT26_001666 [Gymnopilus dilepis]|uniref:Uncharacterized protein n=1 Tax=Gymnopilus dilepis TaxID=231916 RepID=A0A409WB59_9AGAR|nr:hypothetical protein CVT26_001666 [Gymnopilus dilepis]
MPTPVAMVENTLSPSPGGYDSRVPQPCQKLHGKAPCVACNRLKYLDKQIKSIHGALDRSLKLYQETLDAMNRSHNPALHKLTPDILSRIFHFCIPIVRSEGCLRLSAVEISTPFVLGLVCRRWRQITRETPRLWTRIYISFNPRELSVREDILVEWLNRSKTLPLTIIMSGTRESPAQFTEHSPALLRVNRIIDVLVQYTKRWSHLDLRIPAASFVHLSKIGHAPPNLSVLRLKSLDGGARNYIQFSLHGEKPSPEWVSLLSPTSLKLVEVQWSNVTYVYMPFSAEDCLELLRDAPRIKECRLWWTEEKQSLFWRESTRGFVTSRLQCLAISGMEPQMIVLDSFLDRIKCPLLTTFIWKAPVVPPISFLTFLKRSSCSLQGLQIECFESSDLALITFLEALPTLSSLKLSRSRRWPNTQNASERIFKALASTPAVANAQTLLPNLTSFTYVTNCFFPTWEFIPKIFCGFNNAEGGLVRRIRPLKMLQLDLRDIDIKELVDCIDKQTLLEIITVQRSGSKVQIINKGKLTNAFGLSMKQHGLKVV